MSGRFGLAILACLRVQFDLIFILFWVLQTAIQITFRFIFRGIFISVNHVAEFGLELVKLKGHTGSEKGLWIRCVPSRIMEHSCKQLDVVVST